MPPEKTLTAQVGRMDCQTCALSVREKSLTQPFPAVESQRKHGDWNTLNIQRSSALSKEVYEALGEESSFGARTFCTFSLSNNT